MGLLEVGMSEFKIEIPKVECTKCRFFAVGEDPIAFCDVYNKHWDLDEDRWHDNEADKPEWCKAKSITVSEQL